jgi:hypothetical protein
MKFTESMAHLAVALRDPLAEYTELLRAMREGIDDTLEVTERELSRMAAEEGHPFDWGGGTFKDLLRGKPGPGGGFEASPAVLAFFLTAYLLDCPRREAAAKALDMTFAASAYFKSAPSPTRWIANSPIALQPLRGKKGEAVCAGTKQRYFGAAFVALLSDRALFDQVEEIRVSADLGAAQLLFGDYTTSSFYTLAYYNKTRPGTYSMRFLYLDMLRPLFDLINPPEPARAPARKRLLTANN